MPQLNLKGSKLSERDLEFLTETISPEVKDQYRLKMVIREDEDFRSKFIGDERVFRRVMDDDEIFLKISAGLFFDRARRVRHRQRVRRPATAGSTGL